MVKSIVISHDPARSPRIRHLSGVGDFQEAVDGWLDLIEMPAVGVTVYVNEAARRSNLPINCRAMAIWWLCTAEPMQCPIMLGDVVITGIGGDEDTGDVPEEIVRAIFEEREFVVQVQTSRDRAWHDTSARFTSIFDAATWCMVLTLTLRSGAHIRLRGRAPQSKQTVDESVREDGAPW